jgi:hypothetical protein
MVEEKKSDQITTGGTKQSEPVPTNEQIVELVKFLSFNIERQINAANADKQARESRDESARANSFRWQRKSIVGSLILSGLTMAVLVLTLLAVRRYTQDTGTANTLSQKSIEANVRPYLAALVPRDMGSAMYLRFKAGDPLEVPIYFQNFGKLPGDAYVRSVVTYAPGLPISRAEPFSNKRTHLFVWPTIGARDKAESLEPLSNPDFNSLKNGDGFVYVAVEVRYSGHLTLICRRFKMPRALLTSTPDSDGSLTWTMPEPTLCDDRTANQAD